MTTPRYNSFCAMRDVKFRGMGLKDTLVLLSLRQAFDIARDNIC